MTTPEEKLVELDEVADQLKMTGHDRAVFFLGTAWAAVDNHPAARDDAGPLLERVAAAMGVSEQVIGTWRGGRP